MNILTDNLLKHVFYIQNHKMCLSKTTLCQYFAVFLSCLGQLLPGKHFICHCIALSKNVKEKATKRYLKTNEVLLDTDRHAYLS